MAQNYEDWELLKGQVTDHGVLLDKVGPKVGQLVDQYVAGGVEIPLAMSRSSMTSTRTTSSCTRTGRNTPRPSTRDCPTRRR